ncbi:DUF4973 domain-containing protein [Sphingobacterium alkalisoli]|uniref:DUF4973 domain-containing protein n=1 Tax=Sphingobacterium alkalisoli TaxID=1874115 RepID=A0A4U0HC54_9SPHI|nr:DUF4973 domain-containing protein [Sphingobacterium alkalisoli]TJY68202.1 DUF4973 domain-containing protein [Sphingobacterium alkalisoli]GGH08304.1 hypothetical protein GCM10011418_05710 [Sphingobacterium alkalisoli]
MKKIYILFLAITTSILLLSSCNNEWEDEQYEQLVSFKAPPNTEGVNWTYVRYKADGKVTFNLPLIVSGSTPNTQDRTVRIGLDLDTLAIMNREQFGHRQELFYQLLEQNHYSMPESITIPAGQSQVNIPIEFSLADIDEVEKWVLPLQILDNPGGNYQINPHKHYKRAMLRIMPFNAYSGTYNAAQFRIILEGNASTPLTAAQQRAYVVDDETIFFYAGTRDVDYLDRKYYKVFLRFTDEQIDIQKKKLEIWSDNAANNKFEVGSEQAYYILDEDMDPTRPFLKRKYITLSLSYKFEDYTSVPGLRLQYETTGTMAMQRNLNTLIPDEDQQIQW